MVKNYENLIRSRKKRKQKNSILLKPDGAYRHGNLRESLLQTALQLIEERLDVSFTIRELANVAGVSHSAAYRHFKSKKDILVAIAIKGFQKLQHDLDSNVAVIDKNPYSSFRALGGAYVNFALSNPHFFRVMFHPDIKDVEDSPELQAVVPRTFQTLVDSITENQKNGRFIDGPPLELAMFAWSLVHGMSTLYINNNFKKPLSMVVENPQHFIQRLTQLTETGLLRR